MLVSSQYISGMRMAYIHMKQYYEVFLAPAIEGIFLVGKVFVAK